MAYLAIARKYRPHSLSGIVGQEHVTRTLTNAIQADRVHHAFLFCGARGVGKTTAARAFARALSCEKGPTPDPCGECVCCKEIISGASPDLIEIDGASNNSVEDIRDLRETVHYAPTRGQRKIYLIDEVHMLSKAAFNALLKTLEEPPAHVIFIFATTEPNKILDTILSRVQRFDFRRISVAAIVTHLKGILKEENKAVSDEGLRIIARTADGSMRDAQSLLDKVIAFAGEDAVSTDAIRDTLGLIDRSAIYGMLEGLLNGDAKACLDIIQSIYEFGFELSVFTAELLECLRNATFLKLSPKVRKHVDLTDEDIQRLDALTAETNGETLTQLFSALMETHDQVSRSNRPKIILEMAIANLLTCRTAIPVDAILARMEALERQTRSQGAQKKTNGTSGPIVADTPRTRPVPSSSQEQKTPETTKATDIPEVKLDSPPQKEISEKREKAKAIDQADNTPSPPEPPPNSLSTVQEASQPAPPKPLPDTPLPSHSETDTDETSLTEESVVVSEPLHKTWLSFQKACNKLGKPTSSLASVPPTYTPSSLVLRFKKGRALAEAQQALERAETTALFHQHFSSNLALVVEEIDPERDLKHSMQETFLADPECMRIMNSLGAQFESIQPVLSNPNKTSDP